MYITFHSRSSDSVILPDDIGLKVIEMMGINLLVPGSILAQDVPHARARLISFIKTNRLTYKVRTHGKTKSGEAIDLKHQVFPLLCLLNCAIEDNWDVMWERH
ncbi:TPA: DUF1840 family protein [Vibrio fluvialis clinical-1]|nr:DUF1840 domain-containing protein [Vibrio fluvialis]HDM8036912.1 DUF1840 family protein [Vibrio fluvialis clinical-1]